MISIQVNALVVITIKNLLMVPVQILIALSEIVNYVDHLDNVHYVMMDINYKMDFAEYVVKTAQFVLMDINWD